MDGHSQGTDAHHARLSFGDQAQPGVLHPAETRAERALSSLPKRALVVVAMAEGTRWGKR